MRGHAPVSLEAAGDGGAWRWTLVGLHGLAAVVLGRWWPLPGGLLMAALVALVGLLVWRAERRQTAVALRWDGQGWWWADQAVRPRIALDLGGWLLLRLMPASPGVTGRWLPLSGRRAGSNWPALRTALYAGRGPTTDSASWSPSP